MGPRGGKKERKKKRNKERKKYIDSEFDVKIILTPFFGD